MLVGTSAANSVKTGLLEILGREVYGATVLTRLGLKLGPRRSPVPEIENPLTAADDWCCATVVTLMGQMWVTQC